MKRPMSLLGVVLLVSAVLSGCGKAPEPGPAPKCCSEPCQRSGYESIRFPGTCPTECDATILDGLLTQARQEALADSGGDCVGNGCICSISPPSRSNAACNEVQRIGLELQDRLAVAYRRYASARQQVDRYRQRMLPRAKRSLELVTDGYEKGQVKYLTLLTAQQTYVQVNLSYLDSLRELRAASSIIEGQLLTNSLRVKGGESRDER